MVRQIVRCSCGRHTVSDGDPCPWPEIRDRLDALGMRLQEIRRRDAEENSAHSAMLEQVLADAPAVTLLAHPLRRRLSARETAAGIIGAAIGCLVSVLASPGVVVSITVVAALMLWRLWSAGGSVPRARTVRR